LTLGDFCYSVCELNQLQFEHTRRVVGPANQLDLGLGVVCCNRGPSVEAALRNNLGTVIHDTMRWSDGSFMLALVQRAMGSLLDTAITESGGIPPQLRRHY
jgi:hypothetical protein